MPATFTFFVGVAAICCGRFIWPAPADGVVPVTPAQLGYMLEGIDWRHPQRTWRPELAG
jgi:transposase